jgi:6-phosphogluconolactonase
MTQTQMTQTLTRRSFLSLTAASLVASRLGAADTGTSPLVYIGTTTRKAGDGIHVGRWNPQSGTLSEVRIAFECISPSFLAITRRRNVPLLFAGYQTDPKTGGLSGFRIDPSGALKLINTVPAAGADFVHLALDHTEGCLIAANYGQGSILSCKVDPAGHLSGFVSQIQLSGHGPISSRQASPHAHGAAISPNNRFVYINDLGTDRIFIYKLNAATAELVANDPPFLSMAAGSGPRHLVFHPNGRWAYCINELNSTISFLHWNSASGALLVVANTPPMVPAGDVANNRAGELAFDANARFLYACNRGAAEDLLTFSVGNDGRLTFVSRLRTAGKEARHFIVSPDDGYLLVAEQFSKEVAVFARDRHTGILKPTSASYPVDSPSCIVCGFSNH